MQNHNDHTEETIHRQKEVQVLPSSILVLSRQTAESFHNQVKENIYENGAGLFEYLEAITFFSKIGEVIRGKEGVAGDKEFVDYVRSEISKYEGNKFISPRGVKFEVAEVGTRYDFSKCGDPILQLYEWQLETAKKNVAERQEFLKAVPASGLDVVCDGGEVVKVYPPTKTSKSSYKVTLAK